MAPRIVYGMTTVFERGDARVLAEVPADDETVGAGPLVETIRKRGALRVCVLPDRMPYTYTDAKGRLTGLDVELAGRLAVDLDVRVEFVRIDLDRLPQTLETGGCDLAMSGIPVTPRRASAMLFSAPYLDETLAWVVRDELRDQFSSWENIRALGAARVGAPDVPYYVQAVRERAPALDIEAVTVTGDVADEMARFDAFLLPAERGSVITLVHPEFAVVVPEPDVIKVPLAYPLSRRGAQWESFINTWIELKRRDGTIDRLYRHWVLGQDAIAAQPRWSVIRDVLHWVD